MPRRDSRPAQKANPRTSKSTESELQHGSARTSPNKPPTTNVSEPPKPTASTVGAPAPGSGLLSQMAATAGGVAIGSVVGRALGGLFERSEVKEQTPNTDETVSKATAAVDTKSAKGSAEMDVCSVEIQQFLSCAEKEVDLKICEGFKEAMQQCRESSGRKSQFYQL
uniref:CHCH domain-containing protein n=1 Tax=Anopheles farauti TaxID=69004 RepID=A0A182R1A1_9DIPT